MASNPYGSPILKRLVVSDRQNEPNYILAHKFFAAVFSIMIEKYTSGTDVAKIAELVSMITDIDTQIPADYHISRDHFLQLFRDYSKLIGESTKPSDIMIMCLDPNTPTLTVLKDEILPVLFADATATQPTVIPRATITNSNGSQSQLALIRDQPTSAAWQPAIPYGQHPHQPAWQPAVPQNLQQVIRGQTCHLCGHYFLPTHANNYYCSVCLYRATAPIATTSAATTPAAAPNPNSNGSGNSNSNGSGNLNSWSWDF